MAFDLTQAEATELFRRLGQALTAQRRFDLARGYLTRGVYEVFVESDPAAATSAWRIVHAERLKSTDGLRVHVSLDVSGTAATVDLFRDAAKTEMIATGAGALGSTVDLAPVGVDGVAASVFVEAAAVSTEAIKLILRSSAMRVWSDQFRFTADDQEAAAPAKDFLRALDSRLAAESASFFNAALLEGLFRRWIAPALELDPTQPLLEVRRTVADGLVQEQFSGLVPALVEWMAKNAPAQAVTPNAVSVSGATIIGAGLGTLAATPAANLPNGSLELICSSGFPGTFPEQFRVLVHAEDDFGRVDQPKEALTKDRAYRLLALGLRELLLSSAVSQSGTGAFMFDASAWRLLNVLGANTLDGTLTVWVRVVAPTPPNTQYATEVRFYRAAIPSPTSAILDAYAAFQVGLDTIFTASSPTPLNLPGTARSVAGTNGLSITYRLVDVPSDFANGDLVVVNANPFRVGDRLIAKLANDKAGRFAYEFARHFRYPLRTSASPTVDDAVIEPLPDFQD